MSAAAEIFRADPTDRRTAHSSSHAGAAHVGRFTTNAAFVAIVLGLGFAPFWFGSERAIAWGWNALWFGSIAILYEGGRIIGRARHPVVVTRLWFPASAVAIVVAWAIVQILPGIPAGYQHPIWDMARDALGRTLDGAISVNPDETTISLLKAGTAICLFWTTLQLCRAPHRARLLTMAVAVIGALYALYGIVAFYLFPRTILWFAKIHYTESVTSTFVNRNSYATYAGIGLICALALVLGGFAGVREKSGRRIAAVVAAVATRSGAWLAAAFIIGVALALTASRGGISATCGGLLIFVGLSAVRGRKNAAGVGVGLLLALAIVGAAVFSYGDAFADRIFSQGFASDDRLATYRLGLMSIADAPWSGFGWGAFREVFPMYRDATLPPFGVWDLAHNSYLEIAQGLGLPAGALLLAAFAVLVGRCAIAATTRKRDAAAPLVAASTSVLVFLHAFVDFSLQIQAVMLTWIALLAAGVAQSWRSETATSL